jgi:hypothetical protein
MTPDEKDNLGQVVIPNDRVVNDGTATEEEIPEEVTRAMEALEETPLRKGMATAEMERYAREKGKRFEERMGVWYDEEGRMWVPANPKTRRGLMREYHNELHVGHPGRDKTLELLKQDYIWDGMRRDVEEYVKTCMACQQTKIFPHKPIRLLQPIPPSTHPWEEITMDLIVSLPESQGRDAILTIVDRFTKQAHFIPTNAMVSAEGMAWLYRDQVWRHHGWPRKIILDWGP